MSPKRLTIFLMLIVSWPFWLLLRSRLGEHFLILLFLAWGIGYITVWSLMQPGAVEHWQAIPELDAYSDVPPLLLEFYATSAPVWLAQIGFILLHRIGVFMGECQPPNRWYTGCFWVCRFNHAVPDLIGVAVLWFWLAGILSNRVDALAQSAPYVAAGPAACFLLLAYLSFTNGHNLPFAPAAARHQSRSQPRRYLARLRSQAARSREGLGHIFSRRDPALMRIARK